MANPADGDKKNIVKLAYLYFQEGRWDNAIEEYKKLLEIDPEDFNVHNMLGDVYVKKNAPAKAYEEYDKVVTDFVNRGQQDKALSIYKKIARLDKTKLSPEAQQKQNLILLHMQADVAMEENRIEEAMSFFSEILKVDPEDLIVASKLAELDEKIGRIPDAVEQYMRLGEAFLKSHLFKKAQEMFKKVVAMDPQNTMAHLNLAQIYNKQGSENDAKKEYLNIAEQALAKEDLDAAFEYATKAVELKSIEAHYIVGVVLFKRQKLAEAKLEFEILLRFKINHVGAQVYLAKVYAGLEQADKAVDAFQKALKIDKDNVFVLEEWAGYCVKKKNLGEAVKTMSILIDKALSVDDFAHAVDLARTMVSVDEKLEKSKIKLAEVLQASGDRQGAADIYYQLALICESEGKVAEAEQYIKKTLEQNPSHEKAMAISTRNSSSSSATTHGSAESERLIVDEPVVKVSSKPAPPEPVREPAVVVSPQEALKAQIGIADQYVKQGLLDEAIDIYQQLLDVDSDNSEVKQKLNAVYAAYAKTGTDLTNVFAQPPNDENKAPAQVTKHTAGEAKIVDEEAKKRLMELEAKTREEAEKKIRHELEAKTREEAEKKVRHEMEAKAREEAEKKVRHEMEAKAREEAEKKVRHEMEAKAREEAEKKVRLELEAKAREEAEKKADEEIKRLAEEKRKKEQEKLNSVKAEKSPAPGGVDGIFVVAEADLLNSQGKSEEALKLYRGFLTAHPNNEEVRKKISVLENHLKAKASQSSGAKTPPNLKVVESPISAHSPHPEDNEKDSNIKKKSNKIGYV